MRGPVLFSDYVASIEGVEGMTWNKAALTMQRDILCF